MAVFVLDKRKRPLMPCSPKRARKLLEQGRARVDRMIPFTIRLVDRLVEDSELQPIVVKTDPGSAATGIALVREGDAGEHVLLYLLELVHRGWQITENMTQRAGQRRRRRSNNLRYRQPRFNNRRRPEGWLPPSLQHRVDTTESWIKRLRKLAPITSIEMELVRFDMQKLENPEISGVEYQRGELAGYEAREYLLGKWGRRCAYCDAQNIPLEVEHIAPRSKGGSDRVSNLTLSCRPCNQKKGNQSVEVFLGGDVARLNRIKAQAKAPLKDAAAVNSTRWELFRALEATGLPVRTFSGGRTRFNRTRLGLPKSHALDAACVGDFSTLLKWEKPVLRAVCTGRGAYKRTNLNKYGFPCGNFMRQKQVNGFATGDIVKASIPEGKHAGVHTGRVAVRASGSFVITNATVKVDGVSWKHLQLVQRNNGYGYVFIPTRSTEKNKRASA